MANGLFATPEQIAASERAASFNVPNVFGLFSGLGSSVGNVARRGLGGDDTRSGAQLRAGQIQEIMKGTDFKDPNSMAETVNALNEAGFQNEALKIFGAIPTPTKPGKTFGPLQSQKLDIKDDSGNVTTKEQFFQIGSDNAFTPRFSITSSGEVDTGSGTPLRLNTEFIGQARIPDKTVDLLINRFAGLPELNTVNSAEVEDLYKKGLEGRVLAMTNELKQQQREQLLTTTTDIEEQRGFPLTQVEFDVLASKIIKDDANNAENAFNSLLTSGEYRKFVDGGIPLTEPTVAPPTLETTTLAETQQLTAQEQKKQDAVMAVAKRTGKPVYGDPRKGEFSILNLSGQSEGQQIKRGQFINAMQQVANSKISPEDAMTSLTEQGFVFDPDSQVRHTVHLQLMQERPAFAASLLPLLDNEDEFDRAALNETQRHVEGFNFPAYAKSRAIRDYLKDMMKSPFSSKKKGRHGRKGRSQ
jgi:hypothetical protein